MRFGQNVLRMTWKERFVQFSWKAHCFPVLKRISGQCDDFENFDAQKCDLAKTCCAWPEKSVLYNFHGKRTVFSFWENFRPVWRFWELWRSKMRFGQNLLRMTWKERFVQFSWKAHCFLFLERIWGQCDDFDNFDAQKCDLAKTCCAWPEKSVLYNFHGKRTVFLFEENLRPVWRFWQLWRSKMRFGQNVLRMTWKERFVQFSWKAHCFLFLKRILGQCDDFDNFDAQKCDLAKTCCAWPEKSVLYNFHGKRTVFPFLREFEASVTILTTLTLTNAIWPKRAAHDLKRAFCTIFMESALFSRFEENFRPVWRFWELWRSKMRFGQNVLRMTWKERFVQFSWKAHCFPVFGENLRPVWWFWQLWRSKCDLAKTCCAWPEKRVLYNFHEKRTVFCFWREFEASVTILRTSTLTNTI